MDKIKKQFKDFWTYFRLLKYGVNASDRTKFRRYIFLIIAVAICSVIILSQVSMDGFSAVIYLPVFICGLAVSTGVVTAFRPSLIGVAPYTPKQRIVFSYLATLLRGIIAAILWAAIIITFMLVIALFVFIFTGTSVFVEDEESVTRIVGAYGRAHEVLFWVFLCFSAYAIAHIDGKKARNITLICFFVGLEILVLILVNYCGFAKQSYEIAMGTNNGLKGYFFLGSDVAVNIAYLAKPWVVIVVEAVLAVAAFAASLLTSFLRYRSSKI